MNEYIKRGWWNAATLIGCLMLASTAQAASFDCGKAQIKVEKLICGDAELADIDEHMAIIYNEALKTFTTPNVLKFRQKQWLKRRDSCEKFEVDKYITQCLKESYRQRLSEINSINEADLPCPELPLIKSEADKAQCLKRWLARHPLDLNREQMPERDQKFCTDLYQALATASSTVHYVEPILRTEDSQHPGLKRYRQCRNIQPDSEGNYPASLDNYYQGLDEDAHGFRLYRLDLDGNPKNGQEEYLYEEESWASIKNGQTQYVRVSFKSSYCELKDSANVWGQEPRRTQPVNHDWGLNALISFRGRYHLFDLDGYKWLRSIAFDAKRQTFSIYQCNWSMSR